MNRLSMMTLLYRLGVLAERISWWAYDQSARLREEQIHRMAGDKLRSPDSSYGFERTSRRLPASDGAWLEEARRVQAALLQEPLPVLPEPAIAQAAVAVAGTLHPIRPAALSTPPKAAEAQVELTRPEETPRRAALG